MKPFALSFSVVLLVLLLAIPSRAQIGQGEVGLQIITQTSQAGTACGRTFSCTPLLATAAPGERTTLIVRGVRNQPFVVMAGLQSQAFCLPIPGFHNSLVFPPVFFPFVGTLLQQDMIRICPGGIEQLFLTVPMELPRGSGFLLQAVAWSYLLPQGEVPTFTTALQVQVQ